jgi:SAM-dependent methyltransferase
MTTYDPAAVQRARVLDKWLETFFDVTARKPSGWLGRLMYRHPLGHYGFFRTAIDKLQLQREDILLELGCGGGVMLDMVQQLVQLACGIDYSPDMVELARHRNAQALLEGRLEIVQGDVETLPWGENRFTCACGVEMMHFIEDPWRAMAELCRVLKSGGRLVFVSGAEPISALASFVSAPWLRYLRFHSNDELAAMLRGAGFRTVQVQRVDRSAHTRYPHQLAYAAK